MIFFFFFLIPTGLPESLSVYFTGMCFIFRSLERGGRMMRSRTVLSAFLKPTHLCYKPSFVFTLSASAASASFSLSAFLHLWPNYLSQLSPIVSPSLLSSFTFLSILFSHILSAINTLFAPNLQFPLYFCSICPLISFFFHLNFYAISYFLPFGVLSPLLALCLFHFQSHVSIFTLSHSHPFILHTPALSSQSAA